MKAAVFYGEHDLRISEIEKRQPQDNEVIIEVKACGVCGTDLHIYEGAEGSTKVDPPIVLGHELSGVVCETGKGVKYLKVGDRVSVDPNDMCGACYFCRIGQNHFCENHIAIGVTINGGFAEYVTVREKQVYKIPDNITFEEAAMVEPISCCLHRMDLTGVNAGDTVLIIGGGPIGLIMLQLAKFRGAGKLILSEPVEEKRKLGIKLGADLAIDPLKQRLSDTIKEYDIKNVDKVIECVGSANTVKDALECAGNGGVVMIFGLTDPACEVPVKPYEMFKKELTIKASFINPYTFERSISLLTSGKINVKEIITDIVKLEDINKVFEDEGYRKRGKVIIC